MSDNDEIAYTDDAGNALETEPPSYVDRSLLDLDDRYYSPPKPVCECYHDCRDCSLTGGWHVHQGEPCPIHPDAPGGCPASGRWRYFADELGGWLAANNYTEKDIER